MENDIRTTFKNAIFTGFEIAALYQMLRSREEKGGIFKSCKKSYFWKFFYYRFPSNKTKIDSTELKNWLILKLPRISLAYTVRVKSAAISKLVNSKNISNVILLHVNKIPFRKVMILSEEFIAFESQLWQKKQNSTRKYICKLLLFAIQVCRHLSSNHLSFSVFFACPNGIHKKSSAK